jgi:hypothetical protein
MRKHDVQLVARHSLGKQLIVQQQDEYALDASPDVL